MIALSFSTLLALCLQSAPTASTMSADEVRGNVRRAVGFDRIAAQSTGLRASGTSAIFGNENASGLIFDGRGRFVSEFAGPIRYGLGFNGKEAWSMEFGGQPRLLELGERAAALLVGAAMTGAWLAPDSPLQFTVDAAHSDDAKVTLTYKNSPGFESGLIEIDRQTWLPRRFTIEGSGSGTRDLSFEGVREFNGIKLPARIQDHGTGGQDFSQKVETLAAAPTFIRSPYDMPPAPTDDIHFAAGVSEQLEIERAPTGHLLVRPKVNGRQMGWFIVDTGAGATVLDSSVAADLNLKKLGGVQALGVGGAMESSLYQLESFEVGAVKLERGIVITLDLAFLNIPLGHEIAGVLGFDLLSRCVVEFDFAGGHVALHDPAKFKDPGLTWDRLYLPGRIPAVAGKFEGHEGILRLDSGKSGQALTMHYPAVQQFKLLEGRETTTSSAGGVGGRVPTAVGRLKSVEFAGQKIDDLEVGFVTEPRGAFADAYAAGVMGAPLLQRFTIVLDYPGRRIAFRANKQP